MNLYIFSKKIHRFLSLLTAFFGFLMTISGILLKYDVLPFIRRGLVRNIHNLNSISFGILLTTMTITGLILFFYPIFKKSSQKSKG